MSKQHSDVCAVYDMIASVVAWHYMQPTLRVLEHVDIYEFIAHYFTGGQWGYFNDAFQGRPVNDRSGVLTTHCKEYPGYLRAYQSGCLAREIVEAHGRRVVRG